MRGFIGAGLMAIFLAIAFGICAFFGIINANAIIHPNTTYRKVKLLVVSDSAEAEKIIKIRPEKGCRSPIVLKVVWSLRHQPEAWSESHYELHSGDITLWVGNDDYGLKINGSFTYGESCRALLYAEVQKLQTAKIDKATNSLTDGRFYSDRD